MIPAPTLYGAENELKDEDVVQRRRLWYWRKKFRNTWRLVATFVVLVGIAMIYNSFATGDSSFSGGVATLGDLFTAFGPIMLAYLPIIFILFFANFLILFGPLLLLGAGQIKGYEPGDADWGVKLADVRGQAEAKEEITRVVSLWQSGEEFEKAGGKRERGVLFLGAPGTGKTMLSKGIATSFNCPFVSIPGSGFAQTFIGMDAVLVRFLAMKAKRLARKWGGQCIVFIDEIDAVGMRRQSLGSGFQPLDRPSIAGRAVLRAPRRADLGRRPRARERRRGASSCSRARAEPPSSVYPPVIEKVAGAVRDMMIPGMMGGGGGLALNQLLVVMDGIDDPPLMKRIRTKRINTFLDALYIVPRKLGKHSAAAAAAEAEQGGDLLHRGVQRGARSGSTRRSRARAAWAATSTSARPRGRTAATSSTSTWARSRTIPSSTSPQRRDELARITNGYSPAMIDQVCSMALTYAHSDGREVFDREDLVEAMTTVESGVAIGQPYPKHEERSIAIHEAGHAVCGHLYAENVMSTRLSIRKRGSSGGHHQAMQIEDRFVDWRSEQVAELIWILGAMAAEYVFYDQNTTGVGGDVGSATNQASRMVGFHAMAPAPIDLSDRIADEERREEEEERVMERFEKLGAQIMHRSGGGMMDGNPFAATLGDAEKRKLAAGLLGPGVRDRLLHDQAEPRRHRPRRHPARVRGRALRRRRRRACSTDSDLRKPEIDVLDEDTWPVI